MSAKVYDGEDVNFIVDNIIATGLAEGEAIECGQNEDGFKTSVGMKGDVEISKSNDKTGYYKVKLQQSSPANAQYEKAARSMKAVKVQVVDLNDGAIQTSCTEGYFKKTADKKFGSETSEREYEIFAVDYTTNE